MQSIPYWPKRSEAVPCSPEDARPSAVDVVVIGGGQAGLAMAMYLSEAGASVVLLEARPHLASAMSSRTAGMGLVGIGDNPHRLQQAIGAAASAEILGFSMENLSLLESLGVLERTGGIATSKGGEVDEIPLTVEAARALGVPCELWSAERVSAALGTEGLGPGRFTPAEGLVEPLALARTLASRALAAGAVLRVSAPVVETSDRADGVRVHLADGQHIDTEMIVLAAGWSMQTLDPWLGDKLYPARTQMLTLPVSSPQPRFAATAQYGYAFWRPLPDAILVGGCRWATPHLETGEFDDTVAVPIVEDRIMGFVRQHLPQVTGPVLQRWTGIMTFTCDLLPILGPIPGRPRFLLCTGFNGCQTGLAVRSAQAVSEGILTGKAMVPAYFKTGRFVR